MNENGLVAFQAKRNLKKLEESLMKRFGVKRRAFGRRTAADRSREIKEMRDRSQRRFK